MARDAQRGELGEVGDRGRGDSWEGGRVSSWSKSPPSKASSKLSSKSNLFLCVCVRGEPNKALPVALLFLLFLLILLVLLLLLFLLLLLLILLPSSRVWMRECCWRPLLAAAAWTPSSKPRGSTSEAVSPRFVGGWFCRRRLAYKPNSRFLELCRRLKDAVVGEGEDEAEGARPSTSPA